MTADNKQGGRIATEYMIKNGHTRIGIMVVEQNIYTSRKRVEGYQEALAAYKIPFDKELVYYGNYDMETGRSGAEYLLKKGVSAIFAGNDWMAYGAYLYEKEQGLSVPEAFSIIGYDNTELCGIVEAPLTSVDQNIGMMASKAVEVILRRIEEADGESPTRNYYFAPFLVERGSVKSVQQSVNV